MAFDADFPLVHEVPNPWLQGMAESKDLLAKAIANQVASRNNMLGQRFDEPLAQQKLRQALLGNLHQELINKYYGPDKESEIGLRGAQTSHIGAETNKLNQLLPMEVQAAKLMNTQRQQNIQNPAGGNPGYFSPFRSLPTNFKAAYLATLKSMGYNDQQAAQYAMEGRDLGDLAQAKGFARDLSDIPQLNMPATAATLTQLQRSNLATAGLDAADSVINKGISHYSGQFTVHDVPVGFYRDALAGKNKDKQSDFIASSVLAQDQAFLRARQAGAPLSQGLLKHTLETSLSDKKASFPFVKPDVFLDASKKIKQAFDDINKAENRAALGGTKSGSADSVKNMGFSDEDIRHTAQLKGISEQEVRDYLKLGGRR